MSWKSPWNLLGWICWHLVLCVLLWAVGIYWIKWSHSMSYSCVLHLNGWPVVKQTMRCWFKSGCSPIWWEYSLTVKHIIYWPMFSSISVQNSSCCCRSFCVQTDQGSPTNKSCCCLVFNAKKRKRLVCCVIYFTFVLCSLRGSGTFWKVLWPYGRWGVGGLELNPQ